MSDWDELPWHPGAYLARSSQALTVDVFGTIRQSPSRDDVLDALAQELGLPIGGPWSLKLEANDSLNLLHEVQPSQMDVALRNSKVLLFVECKFTEWDGGTCSQTKSSKGPAQCTGNYENQTNPRNGLPGRCALAAKGIRYWDLIPEVFDIRADEDHRPCPFAGPWYQWMRILTICTAVARREGLQPAVAVVYVDRKGLAMAHKDWTPFRAVLRGGGVSFHTLTFQRVLELAAQSAPQDQVWPELRAWVETKIELA